MKKLMFATAVTVCAFAVCAAVRTPEQIAKAKAHRAARLAANGGLVTKPQSGNFARIVSAQKTVDFAYIQQVAKDINTGLHVGMEVTEMEAGKSAFDDVEKVMKMPKTGVALLIVEDDSLPTVLAAPENAWAILNVRKLNDDMPPKDVFDLRVRKEVNRALASAFGAGTSFNKPCVMEPVFSKVDLDALKMKIVGPEAISKMLDAGRMRGIQPVKVATYRQAAAEGWAPAPTNDIQRAILKEAHELPSGPLKIKYDPKRDK